MRQFLREVARGPRASRSLTYEEGLMAARRLFEAETTPVAIAAFLTALRMNGETAEEIRAFVEVLRELTDSVAMPHENILDCAGPYDGRARSFFATIPVAIVLATAGVPVFLHGSTTLPPKHGVTVLEVARALGIPVVADRGRVQAHLQTTRFACADSESICHPLRALRSLREQLGFRTLLNTAEKFVNVGGAEYSVAGVFHGTALEQVSQVVANLGYKKAMVVQGVDGSEDVPLHRASALCIIEGGSIREYRIHPQDYGLETRLVPVSLSVAEQAEGIMSVLKGEDGRYRNAVVLNSALRLWLTAKASSIEQGVVMASDILDSSAAFETFGAIQKTL